MARGQGWYSAGDVALHSQVSLMMNSTSDPRVYAVSQCMSVALAIAIAAMPPGWQRLQLREKPVLEAISGSVFENATCLCCWKKHRSLVRTQISEALFSGNIHFSYAVLH